MVFSASTVYAGGAVVITEPGPGSTVSSPVKICMAVDGIERSNQRKRELILVRVTTTFLLMLPSLKISVKELVKTPTTFTWVMVPPARN